MVSNDVDWATAHSDIPMTQSAPSSRSPPDSLRQMSMRASTSTTREISFNVRAMHFTLGVPTSGSVAVACLFSDERVTWSKSTRRIFATPLLDCQHYAPE